MKKLVWVSNVWQSEKDEVLNWIKNKFIGDPMAREFHTVEELKAIGMVGVYRVVDSDDDQENV